MPFVKATSHRSRDKLISLIGCQVPAYFSLKRNGSFYYVTDQQLNESLQITGVSISRKESDLVKCWDIGTKLYCKFCQERH